MAAKDGCYYSATGNYQIGQTREIVVSNDIPEGEVVRESAAAGDGVTLATCMEGVATFEGDYTTPRVNSLVPLMVGGVASGFGLELTLKELNDGGREFSFPHRYQRSFSQPYPLRSNETEVGYRVIRMTGPVRFGRVDQMEVAQQWSYQPDGARTQSFRKMVIYDLSFVRPGCSIDTESLNQEVALGDYHVGNFATPDRATPWVTFRMTVKECKEPVGLVASFTFGTSADRDPDNPKLISLSGADAPENVGIEIADRHKDTIEPGVPITLNALETGEAFEFNARLRETRSNVRGGRISRPVTVLVEFM